MAFSINGLSVPFYVIFSSGGRESGLGFIPRFLFVKGLFEAISCMDAHCIVKRDIEDSQSF
jgi:hypothetical protein